MAKQQDAHFDSFFEQYRRTIGWTKPPKAPRKCKSSLTVVAGDFHAPFQHDAAIQSMIERTAHRAERLIIAGDLADMFNMSAYAKFKRKHTALEEIVRVQSLLALLAEKYPEVVILRGNHDDRFIKNLQRMGMSPELFEVFDHLHGEYSLHPVYVLARAFKNVKVVDPIKLDNAEFCYLYQQGDAIISHAEVFSQIPNKSVSAVIQSLKSFHEPQGLVKPFKIVIQGSHPPSRSDVLRLRNRGHREWMFMHRSRLQRGPAQIATQSQHYRLD
jgi:Calcineurin-like phosphoesterase